MTARRLGWGLLIVGGLAVVATPVIAALSRHVGLAAVRLPLPLGLYLTGAIAFMLRPGNRAARRLLAYGTCQAALVAAGAIYSARFPGGHPSSVAWLGAAVLEALTWLQFTAALALFTVFPDGEYQRSYERRLVRGSVLALPAVAAMQLLGSGYLVTSDVVMTNVQPHSPFAIETLAPLGAIGSALIAAANGLAVPLSVLILVLRYRRFGPEQRQQIGWPLYALGLTACSFAVLGTLEREVSTLPGWAVLLIYDLAGQLVPLGLVIGMLRYRLLDIDIVVRRSLVYGALWLIITGGYIGLAAVFGVAVGQRVPLALAIVLTVTATVIAAPARRRLERVADHWVFGQRLSGYELLSQLGARLASSPAPEDVAATVATSVASGLGARWVRVILDRPQPRPVAAANIDIHSFAEPSLRIPLMQGTEAVGAIECGPKKEGRYTAADQQLLGTLGGQAALAIRNSQLAGELSERLSELAASRVRLVQAEEAGRRRLERDIHDGVQQEMVTVLVRLGLARNQLRRDKDLAATTLRQVQADGSRALESLQELVRGIHPPILTDRGLLEAVEEQVARLPMQARVSSDGLSRETRFSADIEGGAYFFVSEALTNVLKHANAKHAAVNFHTKADGLTIKVCDDGIGFTAGTSSGSGLHGLQDRIEALGGHVAFTSADGGGATVSAWLPTARGAPDD